LRAPVPQVSVIVLNFNGRAFLDECIASLEAQIYRDFEILLVDNGSTDGSADYMRETFAQRCKLVFHDRNLGFAEGNNAALPLAAGQFIVFLNNDTKVDPEWLARLVEAAGAHPEAGSFASQIRSYDRPEILDTVGIIIYRDGMSRGLGRLQPADRYDEPLEVFAPSGCAAMYRREVLDAVGPFDPDFFAYCEDMDLGMRARLAGWSCWYVPEARVYHHYSGTAGKYSPFKAFLVERNHLWLVVKLFPLRLILASPWYAFVRYALQAYGVFSGKGAAGKFASELPAYKLVVILIRAYWSTLTRLPELIRKRRNLRKIVKVSRREILSWFDRFGISAMELALQD
jgi:GT2 family glycosyltransferase